MLEELKNRLRKAIDIITGKGIINEKTIKEAIKEIQKGLLLSDVNVKIVMELSKKIEDKVRKARPPPGLSVREYVIKIIYDEISEILGKTTQKIEINGHKPYKILLVGLQGSGKTTTAAKLAKYFADREYKVGILSTDTYRPAGREQLKQLCNMISVEGGLVKFFDINSSNPLRIAMEGIKYFSSKNFDIVIIDTAGRHKEEAALMREIEELNKVLNPSLTLLVIDGSIGQQAYSQAKAFNEIVDVGGIIVTKLDGTARGGGALSAAIATNSKVYFIGVGEKLDDFEEYNPTGLAGRLLGIGDLETLLEKFKAIELDRIKRERLEKIAKGRFTLVDMIEQIEETRKLGTLSKLLEYLPGVSIKIPKEAIEEAERKIKKWRIAINSMTDEEKINPSIIKGSRLRRISRGSGVDEKTIKEMVKQYNILKKFMRTKRSKKLLKIFGEKYLKRGFKI